MNLVDVHCHLDHLKFKDDLPDVVKRSEEAGVKAILTSGVNFSTNKITLELAQTYDIVKPCLGLYPIDALAAELKGTEAESFVRDVEPFKVEEMLAFIEQHKDNCIAVGEVGLDYHWIKDKQEEMKGVFQQVIELVEKLKKPIVIHSRKAEQDCVDMLESSTIRKVMMHSFGGNKKLINRCADNGWSFSVPPNITRLQHFQMMVEMVNINQLLTETDAPYLAPTPGERNEPKNVAVTIKKMAELKGMTEEDVAGNVYMNFQKFFL